MFYLPRLQKKLARVENWMLKMGWLYRATIVALLLVYCSHHCLARHCDNPNGDLTDIPTKQDCEAVCQATGDPHFNTFDCVRYEYHGKCDYTLVKNCVALYNNANFEIIGEFHRIPNPLRSLSVIKRLQIVVGETKIKMNREFEVTINGGEMTDFSTDGGFFNIQRYCNAVVVTLDNGITIYWTSPFQALIVIAEDSREALAGNLCGLCGNFNGRKDDDFTTRENEQVYDVVEFGDSWRTQQQCELCHDCGNDLCKNNGIDRQRAEAICRRIADRIEARCGPERANEFFEKCVNILCGDLLGVNEVCQSAFDFFNTCPDDGNPVDMQNCPFEGISEIFECRACGDPHYVTFDGRRYDYQGRCLYILAESYPGAPNQFRVLGRNDPHPRNDRVSITRAVYIYVYGLEVKLLSSNVILVNGLVVWNFRLDNRVEVFRSRRYTFLWTDFGLRVRYDGRSCVYIWVPDTFVNHVAGLCGNLTRDRADDFTTRVGEIETDINRFGDSWSVEECEPCTQETCVTNPCEENPNAAAAAGQTCGIFTAGTDIGGYFGKCVEKIDATGEEADCKYDLCAVPDDHENACTYIEKLVTRCRKNLDDNIDDDLRGKLSGRWRNEVLEGKCVVACPVNMEWKECGPAIPPTCGRETPVDQTFGCVPGCQCQEGLVLSGDECVLEEQCGCTENGRYYKVGEQFMRNDDCTELCTCETGGILRCEQSDGCSEEQQCRIDNGVRRCQEMLWCEASGDPHYRTFDGRRYDYQGRCSYILAESLPDAPYKFRVVGYNEEHERNPKVTLTRAVFIYVYELEVKFDRVDRKSTEVSEDPISVNGEKKESGFNFDGVTIAEKGRFYFLETDFGLKVRWDGSHVVYIWVPDIFVNHVVGLCGYISRDVADDFTTSLGEIETDINAFGDSWSVDDSCAQCTPDTCLSGHPCSDDAAVAAADRDCGSLSDDTPNGYFAECIRKLNTGGETEDCRYDVCVVPDDPSAACEYISDFVGKCQEILDNENDDDKRILDKLSIWRNVVLGGICVIPCPANSEWKECGPNPPRCAGQPTVDLQQKCVQGCQCNDGLVLSGDECVPPEDCGCHRDGSYHKVGKKVLNADCTVECTCNRGRGEPRCKNTGGCPQGQFCTIKDGIRGCNQECRNNCPVQNKEVVCGNNGVTYPNPCELNNDRRCNDPTIRIDYHGECQECGNVCIQLFDPVCGTNGVTYGNECELNNARCDDFTIRLDYAGECQALTAP